MKSVIPDIDKKKFLVPSDLSGESFHHVNNSILYLFCLCYSSCSVHVHNPPKDPTTP